MSDGPLVALTFDAEHPDRPGSRPGNIGTILDALRAVGVRATFFVQGRWADAHPDDATRIVGDGHLVGHHSHYHARMTLFSPEGLAADVRAGHEAIVNATGVDPLPWFRLPFGDGHDDPRVLGVLDRLGYRNVHWNVELEDWEPWRTGEAISGDGMRAVAALTEDGIDAVVLLHAWPDGTADGVPPLIRGLDERGARFATVDELGTLP